MNDFLLGFVVGPRLVGLETGRSHGRSSVDRSGARGVRMGQFPMEQRELLKQAKKGSRSKDNPGKASRFIDVAGRKSRSASGPAGPPSQVQDVLIIHGECKYFARKNLLEFVESVIGLMDSPEFGGQMVYVTRAKGDDQKANFLRALKFPVKSRLEDALHEYGGRKMLVSDDSDLGMLRCGDSVEVVVPNDVKNAEANSRLPEQRVELKKAAPLLLSDGEQKDLNAQQVADFYALQMVKFFAWKKAEQAIKKHGTLKEVLEKARTKKKKSKVDLELLSQEKRIFRTRDYMQQALLNKTKQRVARLKGPVSTYRLKQLLEKEASKRSPKYFNALLNRMRSRLRGIVEFSGDEDFYGKSWEQSSAREIQLVDMMSVVNCCNPYNKNLAKVPAKECEVIVRNAIRFLNRLSDDAMRQEYGLLLIFPETTTWNSSTIGHFHEHLARLKIIAEKKGCKYVLSDGADIASTIACANKQALQLGLKVSIISRNTSLHSLMSPGKTRILRKKSFRATSRSFAFEEIYRPQLKDYPVHLPPSWMWMWQGAQVYNSLKQGKKGQERGDATVSQWKIVEIIEKMKDQPVEKLEEFLAKSPVLKEIEASGQEFRVQPIRSTALPNELFDSPKVYREVSDSDLYELDNYVDEISDSQDESLLTIDTDASSPYENIPISDASDTNTIGAESIAREALKINGKPQGKDGEIPLFATEPLEGNDVQSQSSVVERNPSGRNMASAPHIEKRASNESIIRVTSIESNVQNGAHSRDLHDALRSERAATGENKSREELLVEELTSSKRSSTPSEVVSMMSPAELMVFNEKNVHVDLQRGLQPKRSRGQKQVHEKQSLGDTEVESSITSERPGQKKQSAEDLNDGSLDVASRTESATVKSYSSLSENGLGATLVPETVDPENAHTYGIVEPAPHKEIKPAHLDPEVEREEIIKDGGSESVFPEILDGLESHDRTNSVRGESDVSKIVGEIKVLDVQKGQSLEVAAESLAGGEEISLIGFLSMLQDSDYVGIRASSSGIALSVKGRRVRQTKTSSCSRFIPYDFQDRAAVHLVKQILQSPSVGKVSWNLKDDSKELHRSWGISLEGACDLYAGKLALDPFFKRPKKAGKVDDLHSANSEEVDHERLMDSAYHSLSLLKRAVSKLSKYGLANTIDEREAPLSILAGFLERKGVQFEGEQALLVQGEISSTLDRLSAEARKLYEEVEATTREAKILKRIGERSHLTAADSSKQRKLEELRLQADDGTDLSNADYSALITLEENFDMFDTKSNRLYPNVDMSSDKYASMNIAGPLEVLQKIPVAREALRVGMTAPEGYSLVHAQFEDLEPRILAALVAEPVMLNALEEEVDLRCALAAHLFSKESKELDGNEIAAANSFLIHLLKCNGSLSVLQGIEGIAESEGALRKALAICERTDKAFESRALRLRKRGYVETLVGRRIYVRLPEPCRKGEELEAGVGMSIELHSETLKDQRSEVRTLCNKLIRHGTRADLQKQALLRILERCRAKGIDARIIYQEQNQFVFEAQESRAEDVRNIAAVEMANITCLPNYVQISVLAGVGKSWQLAEADAHSRFEQSD